MSRTQLRRKTNSADSSIALLLLACWCHENHSIIPQSPQAATRSDFVALLWLCFRCMLDRPHLLFMATTVALMNTPSQSPRLSRFECRAPVTESHLRNCISPARCEWGAVDSSCMRSRSRPRRDLRCLVVANRCGSGVTGLAISCIGSFHSSLFTLLPIRTCAS